MTDLGVGARLAAVPATVFMAIPSFILWELFLLYTVPFDLSPWFHVVEVTASPPFCSKATHCRSKMKHNPDSLLL